MFSEKRYFFNKTIRIIRFHESFYKKYICQCINKYANFQFILDIYYITKAFLQKLQDYQSETPDISSQWQSADYFWSYVCYYSKCTEKSHTP